MHYVSWNPIFMQYVHVGATVIEFRFFNQIPKKKMKKNKKKKNKKKKKEKENIDNLWKLLLQMLHT